MELLYLCMATFISIELYTMVGWVAVFGSTIMAIPQIIKTWKTKSVDDLSLGMIFTALLAQAAWFSYGCLIHDWPLIVSAVTPFASFTYLLYLYFKLKT